MSVDLINQLLQNGQVCIARELQSLYFPELDLTGAYITHGFRSSDRYAISYIVSDSIRKSTRLNPRELKKFLAMAEASGDINSITICLQLFDDLVEDAITNNTMVGAVARHSIDFALHTHQYTLVERIAGHSKSPAAGDALDSIAAIKAMADRAGVDWRQLEDATAIIRQGTFAELDKATILVRISHRIWQHIKNGVGLRRLTDGFELIPRIREMNLGYDLAIAPQYCLAGPSLNIPYKGSQEKPLIIVDYHKYSPYGRCVHYKSTVGNRQIVDYCGYSGWSELGVRSEKQDFDSISPEVATTYCDKKRAEILDSVSEYPAIPGGAPYGFIVLQVGADSVLSLAHIDMSRMTKLAIRYFRTLGLKTVVKRHPRCNARSVDLLLSEIRDIQDVTIETAPTPLLVSQATVVATVNSTVGLEAILFNKPLLCFGKSEYASASYTIKNAWDLEALPALIVNGALLDKFYYYYFESYLCFGRAEFYRRLLEKVSNLVHELGTDTATSVTWYDNETEAARGDSRLG